MPRGITRAFNPATGAIIWHSTYTAKRRSSFESIAVSPDGATVYVTGKATSDPARQPTGLTVAYNAATGAILWSVSLARSAGPNSAIAVSPDGSAVFVTGLSGTIAYDAATGAKLWYARGSGSFAAASPDGIAVSPDGSAVFVAGTAYLGPTGHRMAFSTTAYNASTGAKLWSAQYNVVRGISELSGIAASPGGVFVTGFSRRDSGAQGFATVAYNPATGARIWVRGLVEPNGAAASSAAVSPDGSKVFVTGVVWTAPLGQTSATETVAYDAATGATLWTDRYSAPPASEGTGAEDVVVSPDGSTVFAAGNRFIPGGNGAAQFATVAYDSGTGVRRWAALYGPSGQYSYATSLAVSPDSSKVFVTGDTGRAALTLAYNS